MSWFNVLWRCVGQHRREPNSNLHFDLPYISILRTSAMESVGVFGVYERAMRLLPATVTNPIMVHADHGHSGVTVRISPGQQIRIMV